MKWLILSVLASLVAPLPAVAATKADAPAPKFSTSTLDPVEADFQRVMALDDTAHEEIDKRRKPFLINPVKRC